MADRAAQYHFPEDPPITVITERVVPRNWKFTWWRREPGPKPRLLPPDDPLDFGGSKDGHATRATALKAAIELARVTTKADRLAELEAVMSRTAAGRSRVEALRKRAARGG